MSKPTPRLHHYRNQQTETGERQLYGINMKYILSTFVLLGFLSAVSMTRLYSFLLFHSLTEGFSIIIAGGIFMVVWNARGLLQNHFFLFIGIAYIWVGGIDFMHTLAYRGMGIFEGYGTDLPTQLWIAGRYLKAFSLLSAAIFIRRKLAPRCTMAAYGLLTGLILASIFYWKVFPDCYTEGVGLTPFKIYSEYVICLILLAAIGLLIKNSKDFDRYVLILLIGSIAAAIVQELTFAAYMSVYGPSNMMGHLLKIVSFYLLYKAIIQTSLVSPWNVLFRNLKQSEEKLRRSSQFPEENPNPVLRCTLEGRILYANTPAHHWLATLGWQTGEALPLPVSKAMADARGQDHAIQAEITNPAGRTFSFFAVQPPGEKYINLYGMDLSERKRAEQALRASEERLRASLGEKEVLLQEIHHRVKNNMQVISSLVALQAGEMPDDAMRAVLLDVTHRVRSMAMVHEKLYQSADLARIELAEYIRSLLDYLWRAHGTSSSGVRLTVDLEPVLLSVSAAVPCGLILNELVGNALKHAFRHRAGGEVAVQLRSGAPDRVSLHVRDNGTGLPAGFDWRQARSLGLRLVQMLAGQLHAAVEVSSREGTAFTITFGSSTA